VKLVPADRVVPGDRVIYTLEVRNAGATGVDSPSVTYAVPDHMKYVADSAVGPGAEVSYSVDGGHSFDRRRRIFKYRASTAVRVRRRRGLHAHPLAVEEQLESQFGGVCAFSRSGQIVGRKTS
jgi:uncharacterized repeat protein (TIGR01451 family)